MARHLVWGRILLRGAALKTMSPVLTLIVAGSRPQGPSPRLFEGVERQRTDGSLAVLVVSTRPPASSVAGLRGVRWLSAPADAGTLPELRGLALATAESRWVALTEDFCVPSALWAETMIGAIESTQATALGGPIDRDGGRPADWALTLAEYGRCLAAPVRGPVTHLPEINIAYDKEALRRRLGTLPTEVVPSAIDGELRRHGETFWYEPDALMLDTNRQPLAAACRSQAHHGRFWAGRAHRRRSLAWRLLRFLGAWLTPFVALLRIARGAHRAGRLDKLLLALPPLSLLLLAWALGEAVGTLIGTGRSGDHWR